MCGLDLIYEEIIKSPLRIYIFLRFEIGEEFWKKSH